MHPNPRVAFRGGRLARFFKPAWNFLVNPFNFLRILLKFQ
ncbi:hypothetical protein BN341_8730 [Helicobacter heilmannii ASB1.4]|uniref:Uncharacterized protein n=1 Tax=Helicobacter heilmannii TaxID=35817 RepID=A0A0K2YDG0_HELHE|nr:hypothetical protein BN341_8730 [Helicobacter heilmannii ASB1.4]CRI35040.1 hypothetical protein HHE01_00380 [Helicobacter heilmannii]